MCRILLAVAIVLGWSLPASANPNGSLASAQASESKTAGRVDAERLMFADEEPDQWLTTGRDGGGTYFSPLDSINAGNVARLGLAWERKLGTRRGQEATPLIVDGILYTSGTFGRVYALDAATGEERWTYDPEIDGQYGRYACCDAINRGVSVWKGRVFVGSTDGYLHAIDAASGRRIWKVDTLPARGPKTPYTLPTVPVVAGDVLIVGSSGADFAGGRGYLAAYDIETGAFRWRIYTVPHDPKQGPQETPDLAKAIKTWDPRHDWKQGSGGTVWDGISYDPKLKLVYFGTANGAPYNMKEGGQKGGDNLYTAAIVAVHVENGKLAWHYQTTPGDRWDYDSTQKLILTDLDLGEGPRPVLMQASKNGYFYVLDRTTGKLLSANNFAFVSWAKGIDPATGRPIPSASAEYADKPKLIFPSNGGAHSWQPMSYDPQTHLTYIPTIEWGMVYMNSEKQRAGYVEGNFTVQGFPAEDYDPASLKSLFGKLPPLEELSKGLPSNPAQGFLRAWDPVRQRLAWEVKTSSNFDGGVLSTGGGLVFQGDASGNLNVYNATNGARLKTIPIGTGIMAAPSTYRIGGQQYVVVMAGYGGNIVNFALHKDNAAWNYDNESRIIAFKLDGGEVPLPPALHMDPFPKPPAHEGSRKTIAEGEVLYNRFCGRCHQLGRGILPDLRRLSAPKHELFYDIVLSGLLKNLGMGRWDDVLTHKDAEAIHAFIVDESWKAYSAEQAAH
jgi:quinohemoprotein ethanol dehydrogenase